MKNYFKSITPRVVLGLDVQVVLGRAEIDDIPISISQNAILQLADKAKDSLFPKVGKDAGTFSFGI